MVIDGKKIRDEMLATLREEINGRSSPLSLALFLPEHPDLATESFIRIKNKVAKEIGVTIAEYVLGSEIRAEKAIDEIACAARDHAGIIVQFPTSRHLDSEMMRNAIPLSHDVDRVSDAALHALEAGDLKILPPVVGAIAEISDRHAIDVKNKKAVIVGNGKLVGKPSGLWLRAKGAEVIVLDKQSPDTKAISDADILVLGAGSPGLITPDMIKNGVVLFDAGTSEAEGKLAGDATLACAEKCALFTPVPGGIGPITIAMIFKNLLALSGK
jgi:methylenetetrahydrofolate dehydrogenase (NADP+)/methenyltetrahydrofolate cyclohydrolase